MKKNVFLCYFLFFFLSCTTSKYYIQNSYDIIEYNQLTSEELLYISKTIPQNNYIIIDLRPTKQYQQAHIKHAISIPYKELTSMTNIPDIYSSKIIFYDTRSIYFFRIDKILKKINITDVKLLHGGFSRWTDENHPTVNSLSTNTSTNNYI